MFEKSLITKRCKELTARISVRNHIIFKPAVMVDAKLNFKQYLQFVCFRVNNIVYQHGAGNMMRDP